MLLLIGGTAEAQGIARHLGDAGQPHVHRRSPSGRDAGIYDDELSGEATLLRLLKDDRISRVIDASHPFEAALSQRVAHACGHLSVPLIRLKRPEWQPEAGDRWHRVQSEAQVAEVIPKGATVLLTTGREALPEFANLRGRTLLCRLLSATEAPFPFDGGRFLQGTPPFSIEDEMALIADENIDWLVVRNAGGRRNTSKLIAARRAGVPVAMISQPPVPEGVTVVETVEAALHWWSAQ